MGEKLKGFLKNLGPALSAVQIQQPQVTPYPQSGIVSALQGLQGGAASFEGAKDAIDQRNVKDLYNKIRFGPTMDSAVKKIQSGDHNLSPGEEFSLMATFGSAPNPVSPAQRSAGFDVQSGQTLSAGQVQQGGQFGEQLKQQQKEFDEMYKIHKSEADTRAQALGIDKTRAEAATSQAASDWANAQTQLIAKYAPQDEQQRALLYHVAPYVLRGKTDELPKDIQDQFSKLPFAAEFTAEAAATRGQKNESQSVKLMQLAIAQKLGLNSWEEAVNARKVPTNVVAAMADLQTGNIAGRMAQGDKRVQAAQEAINGFLGVDTKGWFSTTPYGNSELPPPGQAPSNPLPASPTPMGQNDLGAAQQELAQLQAQWQGKPNIPPEVRARVSQLRALLNR
jgi:hypothetical protein